MTAPRKPWWPSARPWRSLYKRFFKTPMKTTRAYPRLETPRLLLRLFCPNDVPMVQALAGDRAIAQNTLEIPHPYTEQEAETWIQSHEQRFQAGEQLNLAVVRAADKELVGAISFNSLEPRFMRAELGYWIGRPYWGRGYCSEAGMALLAYGFEQLGLRRVYASHFRENPASGRVMRKLGMRYEGCLRQHVRRMGKWHDQVIYGILKDEFFYGHPSFTSTPTPVPSTSQWPDV